MIIIHTLLDSRCTAPEKGAVSVSFFNNHDYVGDYFLEVVGCSSCTANCASGIVVPKVKIQEGLYGTELKIICKDKPYTFIVYKSDGSILEQYTLPPSVGSCRPELVIQRAPFSATSFDCQTQTRTISYTLYSITRGFRPYTFRYRVFTGTSSFEKACPIPENISVNNPFTCSVVVPNNSVVQGSIEDSLEEGFKSIHWINPINTRFNCPSATPTPSPTKSLSPTPTPTSSASQTPTPSTSQTPTPSTSNTPTPSPTNSPTPSPTQTPSNSATPTPTPSSSKPIYKPVCEDGINLIFVLDYSASMASNVSKFAIAYGELVYELASDTKTRNFKTGVLLFDEYSNLPDNQSSYLDTQHYKNSPKQVVVGGTNKVFTAYKKMSSNPELSLIYNLNTSNFPIGNGLGLNEPSDESLDYLNLLGSIDYSKKTFLFLVTDSLPSGVNDINEQKDTNNLYLKANILKEKGVNFTPVYLGPNANLPLYTEINSNTLTSIKGIQSIIQEDCSLCSKCITSVSTIPDTITCDRDFYYINSVSIAARTKNSTCVNSLNLLLRVGYPNNVKHDFSGSEINIETLGYNYYSITAPLSTAIKIPRCYNGTSSWETTSLIEIIDGKECQITSGGGRICVGAYDCIAVNGNNCDEDCNVPTPSSSPSQAPTNTPTNTPTPTNSLTPTPTPTNSLTPTPTPSKLCINPPDISTSVNQVSCGSFDISFNFLGSTQTVVATHNGQGSFAGVNPNILTFSNSGSLTYNTSYGLNGLDTGKKVKVVFTVIGEEPCQPIYKEVEVSIGLQTPIQGAGIICLGSNYNYTINEINGVWSTDSNTVASVNSQGIVTPNSVGVFKLIYTLNDCIVYKNIQVADCSVTLSPTPSNSLTPTPTPSLSNFEIINVTKNCGETILSSDIGAGGGRGVHTVTINIGEGVGNVDFLYNAYTVPDRFEVYWNGNKVIDTGFCGVTDLNNELQNLGYPPASDTCSGFSSFYKSLPNPSTAIVVVTAPLSGTLWTMGLSCIEPQVSVTPTPSSSITPTPSGSKTPTPTPTSSNTPTPSPTKSPVGPCAPSIQCKNSYTVDLGGSTNVIVGAAQFLNYFSLNCSSGGPLTLHIGVSTGPNSKTFTCSDLGTQIITVYAKDNSTGLTAQCSLQVTTINGSCNPTPTPTPSASVSKTPTPTPTTSVSYCPPYGQEYSNQCIGCDYYTTFHDGYCGFYYELTESDSSMCCGLPSVSPTPTSSSTPTSSPTTTPTPSGSNTPTPSPSQAPTNTPTNTPTPSESSTPTPTPTNSLTPSTTPSEFAPPSDTPSVTPTNTPTQTPTPSPSQTPSNSPTPSNSNTPSPSNTPTLSNSNTPTPSNSNTPTPSSSFPCNCIAPRVCVSGVCECPSGLTDCSGACVDINNNPNHCGGCGIVCPSGQCSFGDCIAPTPTPSPTSSNTPPPSSTPSVTPSISVSPCPPYGFAYYGPWTCVDEFHAQRQVYYHNGSCGYFSSIENDYNASYCVTPTPTPSTSSIPPTPTPTSSSSPIPPTPTPSSSMATVASCFGNPYNPSTHICCGSTIYGIQSGYSCCGSSYIQPSSTVDCCSANVYNPSTHECLNC